MRLLKVVLFWATCCLCKGKNSNILHLHTNLFAIRYLYIYLILFLRTRNIQRSSEIPKRWSRTRWFRKWHHNHRHFLQWNHRLSHTSNWRSKRMSISCQNLLLSRMAPKRIYRIVFSSNLFIKQVWSKWKVYKTQPLSLRGWKNRDKMWWFQRSWREWWVNSWKADCLPVSTVIF